MIALIQIEEPWLTHLSLPNGDTIRESRHRPVRKGYFEVSDRLCRPLSFLLTGGQVADCKAGAQLLERAQTRRIMLADKGYDSDVIRRQIEATGAAPNIPPKPNRRWKPYFSSLLYKERNAIECIFERLKDFRRIATRYDRSATNYLAAVCIAATACY